MLIYSSSPTSPLLVATVREPFICLWNATAPPQFEQVSDVRFRFRTSSLFGQFDDFAAHGTESDDCDGPECQRSKKPISSNHEASELPTSNPYDFALMSETKQIIFAVKSRPINEGSCIPSRGILILSFALQANSCLLLAKEINSVEPIFDVFILIGRACHVRLLLI